MRLAAFALAFSTVALAQPEAAPSDAGSADAAPLSLSTSLSTSTSTAAPRRKPNQRVLCGCASSRFLARGPATIDLAHPLTAWLHGGATLDTFVKDETTQKLSPAPLPVTTTAALSATSSQLMQVQATGDASGYLAITRPGDKAPRDVLAITAAASSSMAPSPSTPPSLAALWLGAAESRERKDCGTFVTQRVHWQLAENSPDVVALVVKDEDSGAEVVVDARHAGAFGLGYVDVCEHGVEVKTGPQRLSITPVAASLARGGAWGFAHDGTGATDPTRTGVPAGADDDLIETGFPTPAGPEKPISLLSVGGVWTGALGAIGLFGLVGFGFWRLKRRRLVNVACTACGANVPVDVLDDAVDGFFCPTCGAAGMWKQKGSHASPTSERLPS
jgi:hypothetical protein